KGFVMEIGSFKEYLFIIARDNRLSVWHMAVLFAIMQLAGSEIFGETIYISRSKVMRLSHIKSAMTYHRCIDQLQEYGYIFYMPSYHPGEGSRVLLLKK